MNYTIHLFDANGFEIEFDSRAKAVKYWDVTTNGEGRISLLPYEGVRRAYQITVRGEVAGYMQITN